MLSMRTVRAQAALVVALCGLAAGTGIAQQHAVRVAPQQSQQRGGPVMGKRPAVPAPGLPLSNIEPGLAPASGLEPIAPHDGAVVQLALLLDTSNSMDGLIDQAKATLWSVVNELAKTRHKGNAPQLQVALYEYGNNSVPEEAGYVRQRAPFTTDLDILSEQLFALRTNGGSEFCGEVIGAAVDELIWWIQGETPEGTTAPMRRAVTDNLEDAARDAVRRGIEKPGPQIRREYVEGPVVKIIVIAGNEPFSQGSVAYQETIARAREAGAVVNTIHCGERSVGADTGWEDGARLGGGVYASIDQDKSIVEPATPYDDQLSKMNVELNRTYYAYGKAADLNYSPPQRQAAVDAANALSGQAVNRYNAKVSGLYRNEWDIVDAFQEGNLDLESLEDDQLPEQLQGKTVDEQTEILLGIVGTREQVQKEMRGLIAKRATWLAENIQVDGATQGLQDVIIRAIHDQVAVHGIEFVEPEPQPEAGADAGTEEQPQEDG